MATKKSDPQAKNDDLVMISVDAHYTIYHFKRTQVFAISMTNKQYQTEKKTMAEIDLRNIRLQK